MNKSSYLSANEFPVKIACNEHLIRSVNTKSIFPTHVQFCPTNKCPLNCSFCSCSDRDKKKELPLTEIKSIFSMLSNLGTRAVTVTGGGEPLAHKNIKEIIQYIKDLGIEIGLVSNAVLLRTDMFEMFKDISWCRFSIYPNTINSVLKSIVRLIDCSNNNWLDTHCDFAFSYVLSSDIPEETHIKNLHLLDEVAIKSNLTHIRAVTDILNPGVQTSRIEEEEFSEKMLLQGRKTWSKGRKDCLISLIKPTIAPDGNVYPCCGVQYAINNSSNDFIERMKMGHWSELPRIVQNQERFDGSVCDVCYYDNYNEYLESCYNYRNNVSHKEFI